MSLEARRLKEKLDQALRKEKLDDALVHYGALERLEPDEPRWPHRKGDLLRRMERNPAAIEAYADAVDLYVRLGFIARGVAMAKVVLGIDPSRIDILERVDPDAARALHRASRKRATPLATAQTLSAPEGGEAAAAGSAVTPGTPPAFQEITRAVVGLTPAPDAEEDEIRFDDGPSIELDLSELELVDRPSVVQDLTDEVLLIEDDYPDIIIEDHDATPTAAQLAKLPGSPIFAELPKAALVELGRAAELVEAPDGALLLKVGDPADALFVIVEGAVRVNVPATGSDDDALLAEGDVFGESCVLDGITRKADVFVRGRLVALKLPKSTIDRLVAAHPSFGEVVFDLFTRRVVSNLLSTSPLFSAFDRETQREIGKLFEARRADEGQVIVATGKRSDALYVLLAGRARLETDSGSARELSPVVIVGQSSLLSQEPLDFTVTTLTEALVLRLPAAAFTRLAATYPPVLAHLAELASHRVAAVVDVM